MFAAAAVMNGARTGRNHRLAHYIRDHIRDTYLARRASGTLPSNAQAVQVTEPLSDCVWTFGPC